MSNAKECVYMYRAYLALDSSDDEYDICEWDAISKGKARAWSVLRVAGRNLAEDIADLLSDVAVDAFNAGCAETEERHLELIAEGSE